MVNYLTFTSVGTTSTVYLTNNNNATNCQYSRNGGTTWNSMPTSSGSKVGISAGQSILVRGTNGSGFSKSTSKYSTFVMTGSISASGSVMSLIDGVGETTTIPANYCFYCLFSGCMSLTSAPELPATTLAGYCYYSMFRYCSSLTTPPTLPATTLASSCYANMFSGCTSLTTPPTLPATTLAGYCYYSMFSGCTSLTSAPSLPATTLAGYCYYLMFSGCTSLRVANSSASGYTLFFTCPSSIPTGAVSNMFQSTGGSYTSNPVANGTYYYRSEPLPYLTFTSVGTTSTVYLSNTNNTPNCQYSADGGTTWVAMPTASPGVSISAGQSIKIRGTNSSGFSKGLTKYSKFVMTGSISASGSVMSLIDGVGETTAIPSGSYCFADLFLNCTSLTTPPELSAITLQGYCYYSMFRYCSSLTTPPTLPATTLATYCYYLMFSGCTSLTSAPSLPATTLATYCYYAMFSGCTSLTSAPTLPATTLASSCYANMFSGCTSLTTPPTLPATTLADGCYFAMFNSCSSLRVRNSPATGYTRFFTCPSTIPSNAVGSMFTGTGGSYTSNPVANGNYYFGEPVTSSVTHVNVNGTWKDAVPYVNVNGTWKEATPYVNVNGTWKESN